MSFAAVVDNHTPFIADKYVLPDNDGQEAVLIVLAATFAAAPGDALKPADEQAPIQEKDGHRGDPASTSVRRENDLALEKPLVDVLLNAQAYAPRGQTTTSVEVQVNVGDIRKKLLVRGDRRWTALLGPTSPEPFTKMPIIWERAYGGIEPDSSAPAVERRNLIGVGHRGARSADPDIRTEVPNIEYPNSQMGSRTQRVDPAGLGAVARGWLPRIQYAGTYDAAWLANRWPLAPADFDPRFNQAAPADQQSGTIRGGEEVELRNLTPDGLWRFRLPRLDVPVRLFYDDRQAEISLRLDTVLIEPDDRRVMLVSRAVVRTVRNRGVLRAIVLGHVTRGWLRAKTARKEYIDSAGNLGTDPARRSYEP